MSAVELRVLGPASLRVGGEERPLPRKALALLAVLCLEGPQSREALAALLWERERSLARQSLRGALMTLRAALTPHGALLHVSAEAVSVDPRALWVDALALEGAAPEDLPGLWRGPLLSGLGVRDSAAWDDWVARQEEALSRRHLDRCLEEGTRALRAGNPVLAATLAARALDVTPESGHGAQLLVDAQWAQGKEALAQLSAAQFRRRFRAEFGADPDLPALPSPAGPPPAPAAAPPAHLPQPLTAFIGRDLERLAVLEALRAGRLVTLHGPAGIGKTRLALQVARDVGGAEPGLRLHFVPLDDLREPGAVLPRLAEGLGCPPGPDLAGAVTAALRGAPTLLVLDNAEHVLEAAAEWPRLLATCPDLRLLVTSREVLNLRVEAVVTLGGLEVPAPDWPPEQARRSDAVRLFEDRARGAGAAFLGGTGLLDGEVLDDVRHIAAQLGGSPLGLELAAAWTRAQTLPELRRSLDAAVLDLRSPHRDARPRHRGLRAALEHSWALLPEEARRDFCALGVFPASFDAGAARAVIGAGPERLGALIDRSLLRRDAGGRYDVHPLVRAFARERLALDPARERRLAHQHASHYRAELGRLNSEASGGASPPLLAYARAEEANILALIDHLLAHLELHALTGVAEPLLWHFAVRGRPEEGLRLCRRVVEALRPCGGQADRPLAAFLGTQGWLEHFFGNLVEAGRLCAEAAEHGARAGDLAEQSRAFRGLGQVQSRLGQLREAVASCQAGVETAATLDAVRRSRMFISLGFAWTYAGEVMQAAEAYARAQTLLAVSPVDSPMDRTSCLYGLGLMYTVGGQPQQAHAALTAALQVARAIGSVGQATSILTVRALAHALDPGPGPDRFRPAQDCLASARHLLGERREPWTECLLEHVAARLALGRGDPDTALAHCRRAFELAWPSGNVTVTFWVLPVYARALAATDDLPRAAEVVGLLLSHPASGGWTRAQAGALLGEWRGQGRAEELGEAVERGAGLEAEALFSRS